MLETEMEKEESTEQTDEQVVETDATEDTSTATDTEDSQSALEEDVTATETEDAEQTETAATEMDWEKYGLGNLKGKDPDYVKNFFEFQSRRYGQQANELGELRRIKAEYDKLQSNKSADVTAKSKVEIKPLTETEMALFAAEFNDNPHSAMQNHLIPRIKESLREEMLASIKEELQPVMANQAQDVALQAEWNAFVRDNSDYENYSDLMKTLMTDDYVGNTLPFEQVYKLAKLSQDEASLFSTTCSLMRQAIPFDKARFYAELEKNAPVDAKAKINKLRTDVTQAKLGAKTGSKKAVTEKNVKTMDDAFGPDD